MATILEQIKDQIDIVDIVSEYIDLSKKGRNYWALCPFHEDSNPSMSVSPDKQLFKCFVCGAGGDAIKFVADYEKISFTQALHKLGEKVGVKVELKQSNIAKYDTKQKEMIDIMKDTMEYFQYSLMTEEGNIALAYAEARKLNSKIREEFKIGFAPNEGLQNFLLKKGYDKSLLINAGLVNAMGRDFFRRRLIFGITNKFGDVVAFSARDFSGLSSAKYINSPESKLFSKSNTLYNFANASEVMKREKLIYINEGFMDVIAMKKAGYRNSVAIMGTALTKEHISYLSGKTVVLMLDSDVAGINATIKSIKVLLENNIKTYVIENEVGKDPDELVNIEGIEKLREVVENKIEALEFIFKKLESKYKNLTPQTAIEFITSFGKYLVKQDSITKDFYINKLSNKLGISKEAISEKIPNHKQTNNIYIPQPKPQKIVERVVTAPSKVLTPPKSISGNKIHMQFIYGLWKAASTDKTIPKRITKESILNPNVLIIVDYMAEKIEKIRNRENFEKDYEIEKMIVDSEKFETLNTRGEVSYENVIDLLKRSNNQQNRENNIKLFNIAYKK